MAHETSHNDPPGGGTPSGGSPRQPPLGARPDEAARYIADFTSELAALARRAHLDFLARLLDMARLEAIEIMQGRRPEPTDESPGRR